MIRIIIFIIFGFWWVPKEKCQKCGYSYNKTCSGGFCLNCCASSECLCNAGLLAFQTYKSLEEIDEISKKNNMLIESAPPVENLLPVSFSEVSTKKSPKEKSKKKKTQVKDTHVPYAARNPDKSNKRKK